jgi:hypothetical protein
MTESQSCIGVVIENGVLLSGYARRLRSEHLTEILRLCQASCCSSSDPVAVYAGDRESVTTAVTDIGLQ